MSKHFDDSTFATNAGTLLVSEKKFDYFWNQRSALDRFIAALTGERRTQRERLGEHLMMADARAAVVAAINPLLVAAYTDELDCVAMLRFPDSLAVEYKLTPGMRLLTVNSYRGGVFVSTDLEPGPSKIDRWKNFHPVIAEFVAQDPKRVAKMHTSIDEDEWSRCAQMAFEYLQRPKLKVRRGSPFDSARAASVTLHAPPQDCIAPAS
ncbi:MAG: hypothetical protein KF754_13280 [Planctomycetes bacterium]|nr:hypothetical protein [Planctomycetota bacterium]